MGARSMMSSYLHGLDVIGSDVYVGLVDISAQQKQMNTLKQVPVSVALILLHNGQDAIDHARATASKDNLPGTSARDAVYWKLKWHEAELAKGGASSEMYGSGADLKKYVMEAFVEANAAEEGAAWIEGAWNKMWQEIGRAVAALPAQVRQAVATAVSSITGVPIWAWAIGGTLVVGLVGYGAYKILAGPVARRYLP
jgi:hypothetical protein